MGRVGVWREASVSISGGVARRANVRIRPATAADAVSVAELLLPLEPSLPGTGAGGRLGRADAPLEVAVEHLTSLFRRSDRLALVATDTDDGTRGANGPNGAEGPDGADSPNETGGAGDLADPVVGVVLAGFDDAGLVVPVPVLAISRLAVAPKQRRRGIGRALLNACIEAAEAEGIQHLISVSPPSGRDGNRYLARVGFVPMATRRIAAVGTVRKALGLPTLGALGVVDGNARLARRRLSLRADRFGRAAGPRFADAPVARPGL